MENKSQHIILSNKLINQINSRASVRMVLNRLKQSSHYEIDFKDIDFISRAAAHELLSIKKTLEQRGVMLTYLNVSADVNLMLQKVENSIKTNTKKGTFVKHITFNGDNELTNYLLAL